MKVLVLLMTYISFSFIGPSAYSKVEVNLNSVLQVTDLRDSIELEIGAYDSIKYAFKLKELLSNVSFVRGNTDEIKRAENVKNIEKISILLDKFSGNLQAFQSSLTAIVSLSKEKSTNSYLHKADGLLVEIMAFKLIFPSPFSVHLDELIERFNKLKELNLKYFSKNKDIEKCPDA